MMAPSLSVGASLQLASTRVDSKLCAICCHSRTTNSPRRSCRNVPLADPDFDAAAFVARCVSHDNGRHYVRSFPETLVWQVLEQNGLLAELANSFLVVATKTGETLAVRAPEPSTLAWSYANDRCPALSVATRIVRQSDGVRVLKEPLGSTTADTESSRWRHSIEPVTPYIVGELLNLKMLREIESENETAFFHSAVAWLDLLLARSSLSGEHHTHNVSAWFTQGSAIDLVPGNVIVDPSGSLRLFDEEWHSTESVPLAWILWRGLSSLPNLVIHGTLFRRQSLTELARHIVAARDLTLMPSDLEAGVNLETAFQFWVQGKASAAIPLDSRSTPNAGLGN